MSELKPCPFCQSDDVMVSRKKLGSFGMCHFVQCVDCGASGPINPDYNQDFDGEVRLWNDRSAKK